jgi:hypothetical protein
MNLDDLMRQVDHLPWFDLAALVQLSGEQVRERLHALDVDVLCLK